MILSSLSTAPRYVHTDNHKLAGLICSIAEGDIQSLGELYTLTSVSIYSFALSILKNSHDAEDVMHDVYLTVSASAATYEDRGKPLAWLLTITKNHCLAKLRKRAKNADFCPENWEDTLAQATGLSTEDTVIIRMCMEKLSDDELRIVTLHAVSGFKHREIADLLSLPLPTVLSKYSRAIRKLKNILADGGTE
ncbi:MAG: RNA polymerase sigma factor [Clostridia bacterium]|nr:RNA polymerase sigma factor [Clostridia bacterium]